ncbi:MAG: hypothetical protein JXL80_02395 [Planctomycetes bacterium]|nr:hypothetical protein [Planctomycetota bacterium]
MTTGYSGTRLLVLVIVLVGTFVLMALFVWPRLQAARKVQMPDDLPGVQQPDLQPGGADGGRGTSR